jgi:hypothetical protein
MQILKLFKMKNCSFKSKTGQIEFFVEIEDVKRIFKFFLPITKREIYETLCT